MLDPTFPVQFSATTARTLVVLVAFIFASLFISTRVALAENVRVGVYENSPKVFTNDKGQPDGLFINLVQYIADLEGWEITYVNGTWNECLDRLSKGTIDLMPDVAFTEDRAKLFDFNKEPVLSSWSQVFIRPDSSIKSVFDLDGKKIAAMRASVQVEELQRNLREFGLLCEFTLTSDFDEAFELVRTGKADAAVSNRFFGLANKMKYNLQETNIVFSPASLYFTTKKSANAHLLASIDRVLREMKANSASEYYKILAKWTGGAVREIIPPFIYWIGGVAFLLIFLGASLSYLLKQQVNAKTKALVKKNESLRIAIEELEKARELALRQERLHALGQMASGITHDFNNILSPIIGYTDLLINSANYRNDPEKRDKLLGIILSAANDGAEIVGRMRQFYRQQTDTSTT